MIINYQRVGRVVLNLFVYSKGTSELFCYGIKNISALKRLPVRKVFYKQIYFTGIEALPKLFISAVSIGFITVSQVVNITGSNSDYIGKVLVWVVVREINPLFVAIIVIMRSCSATASELGAMKINREINSLKIIGVAPFDYIIVPRLMGIMVSTIILSFYTQIFVIIGGIASFSILEDFSIIQNYINGIFSAFSFLEIGISLLKSVVFGIVISAVACYHGFRVQSSITEIPQVTTNAVMLSFSLVFISNGLMDTILFI